MSKADLKVVDPEAERVRAKFRETFMRANRNEPKKADVEALRATLRDHEDMELWREFQGVMGAAETFLLENNPASAAFAEVWRARQSSIRQELGYDNASEVEKLLISHVALCWLRLGMVELQHTQFTRGSHTLTVGVYWDRRLTAAQRRFTRACVELARVRKLSAQADAARRSATAASTRQLRALTA